MKLFTIMALVSTYIPWLKSSTMHVWSQFIFLVHPLLLVFDSFQKIYHHPSYVDSPSPISTPNLATIYSSMLSLTTLVVYKIWLVLEVTIHSFLLELVNYNFQENSEEWKFKKYISQCGWIYLESWEGVAINHVNWSS